MLREDVIYKMQITFVHKLCDYNKTSNTLLNIDN